jgi:VWFA-related protein
MRRCTAAILLTLAGVVPGSAQPKQVDHLKTTVEEVVLDLIVRDKSGRPVRDLQPDQLTVLDNGSSHKVKSLRLVDGREVIASGSPSSPDSAERRLDALRQIRLVTLVFDSLGQEARRFGRQGALDFIRNVPVNALCAVTTIDSKLRVLHEFTTDRDALKKSIEFATSGKVTQFASTSVALQRELELLVGDSPNGVAPEENTLLFIERQNQVLATADPATAGGPAAFATARMNKLYAETLLRSIRFDETTVRERSGQSSIQALMALARGQSLLPGRKVILYFSNGLYIPDFLSDEFEAVIGAANRANVSIYTLDLRGLHVDTENAKAREELAAATRASYEVITQRSGTAGSGPQFASVEQMIYNDRGIASSQANLQNALSALSSGTGGFLIANTNDFRPALRRVNEEINTYYELTYDPGLGLHDASFHRTEVKTTRPELKIQSRTGYYALPPVKGGASVLPHEVPLLAALDGPKDAAALSFYERVLTIEPSSEGELTNAVIVQVPLSQIQFSLDEAGKRYQGRVSLLAHVKDGSGTVVRRFSRDFPLSGDAALLERVKSGYLIYRELFSLAPGEYRLETAVLDRGPMAIGVRREAFTIAPASGLAVSSPVLVRRYQPFGEWKFDPAEPFQYQGGSITPSLAPLSKGKEEFSVFFLIYPDPRNSSPAQARLEYLMDGEIFAGSDLQLGGPDARGRIAAMVTASSAELSPGQYEVRVTVHQGSFSVIRRTILSVE